MDSERFDILTRALSSRRSALGGLLGGVAALLGLAGAEEASAHNPVAGCRRIDDPGRRRRCLRRARAHARAHQRPKQCRSHPPAVTCTGRCGTVGDNCGKAVACGPCPNGKSCLLNGGCAGVCSPEPCPDGCGCSNPSAEGPRHCVPISATCDQFTTPCTSTAECPVNHQCQETNCGAPVNQCVPLCPS